MTCTKKRILTTSLSLFNQSGLSQVTLRTIAKEMGISQGNLNYHFKKRHEIIEGLYLELVDNIDQSMTYLDYTTIDLKVMFDMSKIIMTHFYEYRFFMIDFVQIIRSNPFIKNHYLELTKQRDRQFLLLFNALVAENILRKPLIRDEYLNFYKRTQIMGDFWLSSAISTHTKLNPSLIDKYYKLINESIYPYLTTKGMERYHELIGKNK